MRSTTTLSTTLHRDVKRQFPRLYSEARADLQKKLRLYDETEAAARLPEHCPYTLKGAWRFLASITWGWRGLVMSLRSA